MDAKAWYAVAFTVFILLMFWKARTAIRAALGGHRQRIEAQMAEAAALRAAAEALLSKYQQEQDDATLEAQQIIAQAKKEAEAIRVRTLEQLQKDIATREKAALQRIQQAETAIVNDITQAIATALVKGARKAA